MFKGDSRDFGESLGKRRGEWEGKEKKLKEGGKPSVRFQDEPRPSAPGTERPAASPAFSAEARHYLGLHSQAPAPSRQWL